MVSVGGLPALAGRVPPVDGGRGYGLLLANVLCDLIRVHIGPPATTIRLWVDG
ncbi:hypothetical protein [Allorhizocola rhizosphaerae]|uniref:hypothetical protein n=1 Tax=Allorhizocola rhizosphaerae TaxID=1872709 RepID=UPI001B8D795A|nr:hypothetical protein [Allorhizocola rhizosphaerae]